MGTPISFEVTSFLEFHSIVISNLIFQEKFRDSAQRIKITCFFCSNTSRELTISVGEGAGGEIHDRVHLKEAETPIPHAA